jgi:hypothetical protein
MKQKISFSLLALVAPFLLVWLAFICTAGAFVVKEVFNDGMFWTLSIYYWIIFFPILLIAINDNEL